MADTPKTLKDLNWLEGLENVPGPQPSTLSRLWEEANTPLVDPIHGSNPITKAATSEMLQPIVGPIREWLKEHPKTHAAVNVGRSVAGSFTSPLSGGLTLATAGTSLLPEAIGAAVSPAVHTTGKIIAGTTAAHGAYKTYKGIEEGNAPDAIAGALETGLGALGLRGGLRAKGPSPSEPFPEFKGTKGPQAALDYLKQVGYKGQDTDPTSPTAGKMLFDPINPGHPEHPKVIAAQKLLDEYTLRNRKGNIAQQIYTKDGRPENYTNDPKVTKGLGAASRPLSIGDSALEHQKGKDFLADEARANSSVERAKGAPPIAVQQELVAKKPILDLVDKLNTTGLSEAEKKTIYDEVAQYPKGVVADRLAQTNKSISADQTQSARNLNARDKFIAKDQAQEAKNETIRAKTVTNQEKDLQRQFTGAVNAKNTRMDKFDRSTMQGWTQEARNLTANQKAELVQKAQAAVDAFKNKENVEEGPQHLTETTRGTGDNGETQTLRKSYYEAIPKDENGGDNPPATQPPTEPPTPKTGKKTWASRAGAARAAEATGGAYAPVPSEDGGWTIAPVGKTSVEGALQANRPFVRDLTDSERADLTPIIREAVNGGYSGDVADLGDDLAGRLSAVKDGRQAAADAGKGPRELIRELRKGGPIFDDGSEEILRVKQTLKDNGMSSSGLFSRKAGRSLDRAYTDLRDGYGNRYNDVKDLWGVLDRVAKEAQTPDQISPVDELNNSLRGKWWEPVRADVTDYEAGPVPTLDVEPPAGQSTEPVVGSKPAPRKTAGTNPRDLSAIAPDNPVMASLMDDVHGQDTTMPRINEQGHGNGSALTPEELATARAKMGKAPVSETAVTPESEANDKELADFFADLKNQADDEDRGLSKRLQAEAKTIASPMGVPEFAAALSKEGQKPIAEAPFSLSPETAKTAVPKETSLLDNLDTRDKVVQAAAQHITDIQSAEPSTVPEGGAAPVRVFKSPLEAAGDNYGAVKAAKKAGEKVPEAGRAAAGKAAHRLQIEADAAEKAREHAAQVQAAQETINDPATKPLEKEMWKRWLEKFLKEEGGFFDPGAVFGRGNKSAQSAGASTSNFAESLRTAGTFINNLRRATLLNPYSVAKKGIGDVQALGTAAIEHPSRAGDIMRSLFDPETVESFKSGWNAPSQNIEGLSALEDSFQSKKNPLGWSGRTMSGLTQATKGVLERSGFTPEEAQGFTLTKTPSRMATAPLYELFNKPGFNHLNPFSRIALNWLEQGYEHSPAGLFDLVTKDLSPEERMTVLKKAGVGTAAGFAAYKATPDDFVKEHPALARTLTAGPLGPAVLAGMLLKNQTKDDSLPIGQAATGLLDELPGMRLAEDLRDPKGFGRNYVSSYTNFAKPIAELLDSEEKDLYSKDLSPTEALFNKAIANIPGLRSNLPSKPEKKTLAHLKW